MTPTDANTAELETIHAALAGGQCLLLVLSRKRPEAREAFSKVSVRPVTIQNQAMYQFSFTAGEQVTHETLEPNRAARRAAELFSHSFEQGTLFTPSADYALRVRPDGSIRLRKSPPTKSPAP